MMWVETTTRQPSTSEVMAQLSITPSTALPLSRGTMEYWRVIILRREPEPVLLMQQLVLNPNS